MKSQPGSSQLQSFLEELYERYKLPLLRMIHKHVGDSGVGEDLFHEVFIRIIHKAKLWLDTGAIFGDCAAQFQRVVLACPKATVEQAMERLKKAVTG